MDGLNHNPLQLDQPLLHLAPGFGGRDGVHELHDFPLAALHVRDIQGLCELDPGNAFKAFLQVRLYSVGGEKKIQQLIKEIQLLTCRGSFYTNRLTFEKVSKVIRICVLSIEGVERR